MEQATTEYLKMYDLCLAGCEGSYEVTEYKDFYPTLAGECLTNPHLLMVPIERAETLVIAV